MHPDLCDVSDISVFEIENTFGELNDGRGIGSDEEFDGLGKAIL